MYINFLSRFLPVNFIFIVILFFNLFLPPPGPHLTEVLSPSPIPFSSERVHPPMDIPSTLAYQVSARVGTCSCSEARQGIVAMGTG